MFTNVQMTGEWYHSPLITSATPVVKDMVGAPLPCTVKLYVTAGDTLVLDQSFDGGATYDTPIVTATSSQGVVLTSGCSQVRVTRTAGTSGTSYFTVC